MSRVEGIASLLQQIEQETCGAFDEHTELLNENRRLEAENAKLRKLAVRMFHTIEWSDRMSDSMYWPSFSYEKKLRELGIEVER